MVRREAAHPYAGLEPRLIPKLTADAIDTGMISRVITIAGADAMKWSRSLAQEEGIFVDITAGGTFAGETEVCKSAKPGDTILAMLPDAGERYLSTPLFGDIGFRHERGGIENFPTRRRTTAFRQRRPSRTTGAFWPGSWAASLLVGSRMSSWDAAAASSEMSRRPDRRDRRGFLATEPEHIMPDFWDNLPLSARSFVSLPGLGTWPCDAADAAVRIRHGCRLRPRQAAPTPPRKGASAGFRKGAQARLDPGEGAGIRRLFRDAAPDAR